MENFIEKSIEGLRGLFYGLCGEMTKKTGFIYGNFPLGSVAPLDQLIGLTKMYLDILIEYKKYEYQSAKE